MSAVERRRILVGFACLAIALVIGVLLAGATGAGAAGGGELTAQPAFGAPAETMLGASPGEASGEVWAIAPNEPHDRIARYTDASGWETLPSIGEGVGLASGSSAGRTTPGGGVIVAATVNEETPTLIVRDPGGSFHQAPEAGAALEPGESLLGTASFSGRMLAAVEEPGGKTGAFVVPSRNDAVLGFDGSAWAREPICVGTEAGPCVAPPSSFRVLSIDASGEEAWLLGKNAAEGEGIELFKRETGGGTPEWRQRSLGTAGSLGASFGATPPAGIQVTSRGDGQPLTVTTAGVWVDALLTDGGERFDATIYFEDAAGKVVSSWCDLSNPAGLCTRTLGAELPSGQNRSFAWPPEGGSGPYGRRTITGVGQGAILNLEGTAFTRVSLAGGGAGAERGAALSAPDAGWLGADPPLRLTRTPQGTSLQSWPVTFRRPLTAIASQPGTEPGALGSEAMAVGDDGQVARYVPAVGWEPESLLTGSGKRATPTLRGVAWPEDGRAFAVGDGAAMWVWQRATGLWEPDPAKPPNLARANFTAIAFDPGDPSRGYAVGKQGLLLSYGRLWQQEALPPGVPVEANFTSVAFAGGEAFATWKYPLEKAGTAKYTGGVLVNDGSGWRAETAAETAFAGAVPQHVAGLPDGGVAIASTGVDRAQPWVIERSGPGSPWQVAAGNALGYPVALAAVREGSQVRAIVSVAEGQDAEDLGTDFEQVFNLPGQGQPPLLTSPYPLPGSGLLARQTEGGWRDEQHEGFPLPPRVAGQTEYDLPQRPDWVLALLTNSAGSQGWAVGGETGTSVITQGESAQTAGVMRYGTQAAPPSNAASAPIAPEAGVNFAIAGGAQCAEPCADLSGSGIGPDRWLKAAVGRAAGISGLRAFLYSGSSVAEGARAGLGGLAFQREENAYANRLGAMSGGMPVFAAAAASDLDKGGTPAAFLSAFGGYGSPLGQGGPGQGVAPLSPTAPGKAYYSFSSAGTGGSVRVVVLDYSATSLGSTQSCWLSQQLSEARGGGTPAIVVGSRDLAGQAPNSASDATLVTRILTGATVPANCSVGIPGAASAYFFEFPEQNRQYLLSSGQRSVPAFGSGTLGYVKPPRRTESDFVGAGGFLLASVKVTEKNSANVAPVKVRLVPNIGALALEPTDGTLVRRSHVALFNGLARRPLAGGECGGNSAPQVCETIAPDPYVPIPSECHGGRCASGIFPDYTFTSSEPEIADFVSQDPNSLNPRTPLLVKEKPVVNSHSGLLCAFNEGTTTVTVSTGGLSYSQKVTVLGGTAQRPCGTTPLRRRRAETTTPTPGTPPPPPPIPPTPPPLVPPAAPTSVATPPSPTPPAHPTPPALPPTFFSTPTQFSTPIVPIVPPPPPLLLQPTPPSGSSYVQEKEEEEEEAVEHSSAAVAERLADGPARRNALVAGGGSGNGGLPVYGLPALALVAALAAVGIGRPRRRSRRRPIAYQWTNSPRRDR